MFDPAIVTNPSEVLTTADVLVEITAGHGRATADLRPSLALFEKALRTTFTALARTDAVKLETLAILEEVPQRALSLWCRVENPDPSWMQGQSSETFLKFVGRGTLTLINWMEGKDALSLGDLQRALRVLVWGTSAVSPARPSLPTSKELVQAVIEWQEAKQRLSPIDSARVLMEHGSAELDLGRSIHQPATFLLDRVIETGGIEMILIVDSPDYEGTGKWTFRSGDRTLEATVSEGGPLQGFYTREIDLRPGDALHCRVEIKTLYGPDHEVIGEELALLELLGVLRTSGAETVSRSAKADQPTESVEVRPETALA